MDNNLQEKPHVRRKRYSGTHPKTFEEKYKEHNPDKYKDTIEKVISKGSTPAGMHISIMVNEILDVLNIKPGEKGLDATLGYGGHTRKMLNCLNGNGHVYGLDVDETEIAKTTNRLRNMGFSEDIFTSINTNFANIGEISKQYGPFDFVLADLGVSSMQIDNPKRGFSYKLEGVLDLRLNQNKGVPAHEKLAMMTKDEIIGMLVENSNEPYAVEITNTILKWRKSRKNIDTTSKLKEVIEESLSFLPDNKEKKDIIKKTCQRVFQAIRIDINSEFEVLDSFLYSLPDVVKEGGRVAILTFHSGEDRLVKKAFKEYLRQGIFTEISKDVIRPSAEECNRNPRARSTKLRWAKK
ncbi:MAG: 16S rRNA (cytosine(1402)-N(4))-methyltransferase RsmH [Lachnospiraceae bacterium]|nr:16S rRNA (cytosine(1402)-N(4))-methyltransferase RsmH [Lachnospiraceae bacterium]